MFESNVHINHNEEIINEAAEKIKIIVERTIMEGRKSKRADFVGSHRKRVFDENMNMGTFKSYFSESIDEYIRQSVYEYFEQKRRENELESQAITLDGNILCPASVNIVIDKLFFSLYDVPVHNRVGNYCGNILEVNYLAQMCYENYKEIQNDDIVEDIIREEEELMAFYAELEDSLHEDRFLQYKASMQQFSGPPN